MKLQKTSWMLTYLWEIAAGISIAEIGNDENAMEKGKRKVLDGRWAMGGFIYSSRRSLLRGSWRRVLLHEAIWVIQTSQ
jgi:hypothetical protein